MHARNALTYTYVTTIKISNMVRLIHKYDACTHFGVSSGLPRRNTIPGHSAINRARTVRHEPGDINWARTVRHEPGRVLMYTYACFSPYLDLVQLDFRSSQSLRDFQFGLFNSLSLLMRHLRVSMCVCMCACVYVSFQRSNLGISVCLSLAPTYITYMYTYIHTHIHVLHAPSGLFPAQQSWHLCLPRACGSR